MTREDLKKTFEMIDGWSSHQREPTLFFSSQEECDQFFDDLAAFTTAPREGAVLGGHDVEKLEEEGLLVQRKPAR